ncbi:methyl-accepting chemotaxis protein [Prodigiosinella confusarubida]|uniref:Methyl-accepting chemotaxis protein n=1 Tax=Serratia sp. (strain ATCC 39006) TaxID=104623 RepID=A0A2I5TCN4_SERS3|nr:methyl-accepting chemotaxis protein [Serratia sp. ATCC 39006]AUH02338.1 methyl-accepting chemotaxis protein [Serratia sp. ATCC 39006]AUH06660.1 methyl-accepting chemotaxis protein [Serratia sp. ATCC 39006]
MKKLSQLTVLAKLLSGFSVLVAMMLLLGVGSLYLLNTNNDRIKAYSDSSLPGVRYSLEMRGVLSELRLQQIQYIDSKTPEEREGHRRELLQNQDLFLASQASYEKLDKNPEKQALFQQIADNFKNFSDVNVKVIEAVNRGDIAEAAKISGAVSSKYRSQMMKDLAKLVEAEVGTAKQAVVEANKTYNTAKYSMLGLLLLALIATGVIATIIARSLSHQLGGEPYYAMEIMAQIAAGNLNTEIKLRPGDESSLLATMKYMNQQLEHIIHGIVRGSESISLAANEMAQGNSDLSQRTEEQAASLVQTSSNMQQITETVKRNADNASQASELARRTSTTATNGGSIVDDMLKRMHEISDSSQKIVDIISVIEGIAFQTNILALNAAVEAARAGSEGKGFAVVASEVRTLAQKSADAAKEIKALIEGTVDKITDGSRHADNASHAMADIVESVNKVTDIVAEISMASNEQHVGIKEISVAIDQMDQVTQQNAALVEQAATAAQSMTEQSEQLRDSVRFFQLEQDDLLRIG